MNLLAPAPKNIKSSLFQTSVLKRYLSLQDEAEITKAYKKFIKYFHRPEIQQNIRKAKEEQFQEGFLRELFVKVLGYTLNPDPKYNLTTELKNEKNAKKADGAILNKEQQALAVVELKCTKTKDLESISQQAFGYKANQTGCEYVITSNFEKLRFYIGNAVNFTEFNLFTLTEDEFALFYLCLHKSNLLDNLPLKIKNESLVEEKKIESSFYKDYSVFKRELYRDLVKQNMKNEVFREELTKDDSDRANKNIKLTLFKKSQKLIDRFLFIFFAEDRGLLPHNSTLEILEKWNKLHELDAYTPLYERFIQYFGYLDTGRKGNDATREIFAYNGGLFKPDPILDSLRIDDTLLATHTEKLANYDFDSQIDVNILGHIFEHSLNEIESVNAEIEGGTFDKQKSKRKKDGVFYTPKYITKYIVENTVGKLCTEKKSELGIKDEDYVRGNKQQKTLIAQKEVLEQYREWLLSLTILDPACGSGAFLNQALNFLIQEHAYIDELQANLLGMDFVFPNIENTILERNIYGVDLNEESVEIAKLSLWLRTAQPKRKLNDLNSNIKCGNSLIDNKTVAGDKAFNWQEEFPEIFANGGFDVVIGNPPYGASLNQMEKDLYSKKYQTFQGNHEIYFFFIELLDNILKDKGQVGYITPDSWMSIPQAQRLRRHVLEVHGIENIVSFNYSVFAEASVNAVVFILRKGKFIKECSVIHSDNVLTELNICTSNSVAVANWIQSNDNQFQIWQNNTDIKIIEKIVTGSEPGANFLDVCQGIVPYSTEHLTKEQIQERIYHSREKVNDTYGKWVQGRAIVRYSLDDSKNEFLKYGHWLHRSRKPQYFNGERILIQEITGGTPPRISAALYTDVLYHDPGIISCLNISKLSNHFLLSIINSKLISWYNLKTSPKGKRTTFPKVLIGDIRKFPIKNTDLNNQLTFNKKVDYISSLTKSFINALNSFRKYIKALLAIEKLSKKLQNWHELEFADFIKELNKAIKKSGGEPLSPQDGMEWMEHFETKKAEAQTLKSKIDEIDKEIDQMVYKLYGLTEEEIKIVEEI